MTVVVTALAVVVVVLALLVAGLLRSHAVMLRRLHEAGIPDLNDDGQLPLVPPDRETPRPNDAPTGRSGSDLTGVTPSGDPLVIAVAERRHDTSLLFLSSDCLTCQAFWEAVGDGRAKDLDDPSHRLVVVTRGPESELAATIGERPADVPVIMSTEAWESYGVPGSPYFVHVDGPSGRVRGEGTSASWEAMVDLAGRGRTETADAFERSSGRGGHRGGRRGGRRGRRRTDDRPVRDSDEELRALGIEPDDASLYPDGADTPGGPS